MLSFESDFGVVGVGYEGCQIGSFVQALASGGVGVVADVRMTPLSRKPGFSKQRLAAALAEVGLEYLHLGALGNPKPNRPGFTGSPRERHAARALYLKLLKNDLAADALDHLAGLALKQRVAVLCFEADEGRCHRDLVLSAVQDRLSAVSLRAAGDVNSASGSTRRRR